MKCKGLLKFLKIFQSAYECVEYYCIEKFRDNGMSRVQSYLFNQFLMNLHSEKEFNSSLSWPDRMLLYFGFHSGRFCKFQRTALTDCFFGCLYLRSNYCLILTNTYLSCDHVQQACIPLTKFHFCPTLGRVGTAVTNASRVRTFKIYILSDLIFIFIENEIEYLIHWGESIVYLKLEICVKAGILFIYIKFQSN